MGCGCSGLLLGNPATGSDDLLPCNIFGKPAEAREDVKKGASLSRGGKLEISECTDGEGHKRPSFRVLADTYRLV